MILNLFISDILGGILSLILFIVALGVLITIHELGHFLVAKMFKVYCSDFSIGFGPKILKIKRKKGETRFSIGIIPLGGYVSMYGEEGELEEGVNIPKERSLGGISRWKRILIMSAGIVMNFILAYLIFLIAVGCFEQSQLYINLEKIDGDSQNLSTLRYEDGSEVDTLDSFNLLTYSFKEGENTYQISNIIKTSVEEPLALDNNYYILGINMNSSSLGIYNRDVSDFIVLYQVSSTITENVTVVESIIDSNGEHITYTASKYTPVINNNALVTLTFNEDTASSISSLEFKPVIYDRSEEVEKNANLTLTLAEDGSFNSFGYQFYVQTYWNGVNSFARAGSLWGQSCTLISQALGNLFIGQGWDQLGGPVAILTQTTSTLINNPFYVYLTQWGMISVNLALFNLLPFPGLDGWQILVEIVEGSVNGIMKLTKKKKKKSDSDADVIEGEIVVANTNEKKEETSELIDENTKVEAIEDTNVVIGEKEVQKEEGEWKIPAKVKGIMSYIGLGLLFLLMIVVFIKDILGLF